MYDLFVIRVLIQILELLVDDCEDAFTGENLPVLRGQAARVRAPLVGLDGGDDLGGAVGVLGLFDDSIDL